MPLDRTFLGLKDSKCRDYSLYFKLQIVLGEEARLSPASLQALWELESQPGRSFRSPAWRGRFAPYV
jgi:hypothetical protein